MERDWKESSAPKWVKDAAQAEIDAYRLTAALSWPTEARPSPLPFRWGAYDRLVGDPAAGEYWFLGARDAKRIEIAGNEPKVVDTWKKWVFRYDGGNWTCSAQRGPLFSTKRDAQLYLLWDKCEDAAKTLLGLRAKISGQPPL